MADHIGRRTRGYLPHWEVDCGTYFVTFRLGDSLPRQLLDEIRVRRDRLQAAGDSGRRLLPVEQVSVLELSSKRVQDYLDAGRGSCALKDSRIAAYIGTVLGNRDGDEYRLLAWCIMPNHVHVLFRTAEHAELSKIVGAWKSVVAHRATKMLGLEGSFWAREYYDHLITNESELLRAAQYVRDNPGRAGLSDWPWVWCDSLLDV